MNAWRKQKSVSSFLSSKSSVSPLLSSPSAAPSSAPAITTTDVVPSPASTSWECDKSTIYVPTTAVLLSREAEAGRAGMQMGGWAMPWANHLRCSVLNLHALDNRGAIVGDDDVPAGGHDLRDEQCRSAQVAWCTPKLR